MQCHAHNIFTLAQGFGDLPIGMIESIAEVQHRSPGGFELGEDCLQAFGSLTADCLLRRILIGAIDDLCAFLKGKV